MNVQCEKCKANKNKTSGVSGRSETFACRMTVASLDLYKLPQAIVHPSVGVISSKLTIERNMEH